MDYDTQQIFRVVVLILLLVISLGVHEAAHAWMANRCGDDTAKRLGRMTLNPIPHIDLFNTILLPAMTFLLAGFVFGGAKPVPVDYTRLRNPPRDMALVAIAGPASNLLLAMLAYASIRVGKMVLPPDQALRLWDLMQDIALANLMLAVFNMLPVPPLDGSRVMTWLLPSALRPAYMSLERFGLLIVVLLMFYVTPVKQAVVSAAFTLERLIGNLFLS